MRILVICPFPVFPSTHGGSARVYRLAVGLARAGAAVDVLNPWYPGQPLRFFRRAGVTWHPHTFPANLLPLVLPERLVPASVAASWQPSSLGPKRRLRGLRGYDVVQFDTPANFAWIDLIPLGPACVYSAHNVEYDYLREERIWPLLRSPMESTIRAIESRAVRRSDLVVACTKADSARLAELYGHPAAIEVIPNGFGEPVNVARRGELRERVRRSLGIGPRDRVLLFLGGRAEHNLDARAALEQWVIPRLLGDTTLLVAGRCGSARATKRVGQNVRYLGYVEDLTPLFAAADVGLNPVRSGSGSSVKIADYLAAGLQIVSTPMGMRGFERFRDRIQVAELDEFAETIEALPRSSLGEPPEGLEELSVTNLGRRLHRAYQELLSRAG